MATDVVFNFFKIIGGKRNKNLEVFNIREVREKRIIRIVLTATSISDET